MISKKPNLTNPKLLDAFNDLELERRKRKIENIDYWRALNPDFSITDNPFPENVIPYSIAENQMEDHLVQIKKEGYFQTQPIIPQNELLRLEDCIREIIRHGHKSDYALLYDEFYVVMGKLEQVLSPVLGRNYQLVPDEFGVFYIPNGDASMGTKPHRDTLGESWTIKSDGTPNLVNVWIPITDATTLNSCIYVIPANLDPDFAKGEVIAEKRLKVSLQDIRALPVKAGSILCWTPHLLHWGARSSRWATTPRISFAMYFQSREVEPYHKVTMDIPSKIPFEYRLYLLEKFRRDPEGLESKFSSLQETMRKKP